MSTPTTPSLLSPANLANVVGNVLVFAFTVPSDDNNQTLVFRIELDTSSSISSSSSDYKVNESRFASNGVWQVMNASSVYVPIPTGGIGSSYYGNVARVTLRQQDTVNFPNSLTNWYWRISASDNIIDTPVFNKAVFGQSVFLG